MFNVFPIRAYHTPEMVTSPGSQGDMLFVIFKFVGYHALKMKGIETRMHCTWNVCRKRKSGI